MCVTHLACEKAACLLYFGFLSSIYFCFHLKFIFVSIFDYRTHPFFLKHGLLWAFFFFLFFAEKLKKKKVLFKLLLSFDTVIKEVIQYNMMVCCTTTWTLGKNI